MDEENTPQHDDSYVHEDSDPKTEVDTSDLIATKTDIVADREQVLRRAIERWIEFYKRMWNDSNVALELLSKRFGLWGTFMRVAVIILSVAVTTISGLDLSTQNTITILAGILTVATSIEGFFLLLDRQTEVKQMQREIQTLRDKLAYDWMVNVELETEMDARLDAAKNLLESGPAAYNEILNKYAFKSEDGDS